jgi:hypothetical protein
LKFYVPSSIIYLTHDSKVLDTVQADRLKVYYGEDDGWCPLGHRDNILMVSLFVNKYYISKSLKVLCNLNAKIPCGVGEISFSV